MLLGVGTDNMAIRNAPPNSVATAIPSNSENIFDLVLPPMSLNPDQPATVIQRGTSTSAVVQGDNIPIVSTVIKSKDGAPIIQGESVSGRSSITKTLTTTTADCGIAEVVYPKIGSPSADLMVVNTNGFNPLQHAALRGNPG